MTYFRHVVTGLTPVGTRWSTTLHSNGSAAIGPTQTAWNQFITSFVGGTLAAMWNTHTTVDKTLTYSLDPVTGKATGLSETANAIPGTGTGGSLSSRTAFVVTTNSAVPGKPGRGRMFWPVPDDSHIQTNGQLVSADGTTLESNFRTAYATFKLTSVGVVYHKALHIGDAIVEIEIDLNLKSQRRRTNKAARVIVGGPV